MKLFYIPDGHRRYMDREGCTLPEAYNIGYHVLINEIIKPLFLAEAVEELGIFLLSNLNLERRDSDDLKVLLDTGQDLLPKLIHECRNIASIQTYGTYLSKNIIIQSVVDRRLNLFLGCRTCDKIFCSDVDIFIRSGGELRMSGAPRSVIGDWTHFYKIDKLHPDITFLDIQICLDEYRNRYVRETIC